MHQPSPVHKRAWHRRSHPCPCVLGEPSTHHTEPMQLPGVHSFTEDGQPTRHATLGYVAREVRASSRLVPPGVQQPNETLLVPMQGGRLKHLHHRPLIGAFLCPLAECIARRIAPVQDLRLEIMQPDSGNHTWHVIGSSNQRQSEAIRGNQMQSEAIRGNQTWHIRREIEDHLHQWQSASPAPRDHAAGRSPHPHRHGLGQAPSAAARDLRSSQAAAPP